MDVSAKISKEIFQIIESADQTEVTVDLGCGAFPRNPFKYKHIKGFDIQDYGIKHPNFEFVCAEKNWQLPFDSNSIDAFTAFDFLEHVPRLEYENALDFYNPFIRIMNEIWRSLKPQGYFLAVTPAYPSSTAFQDPTHHNIISIDTYRYFTKDNWAHELGYGFYGNFELILNEWLPNKHAVWKSYLFNQTAVDDKKKMKFLGKIIQQTKNRLRFSHLRNIHGNWKGESHVIWLFRKMV